MEVLKDKKAANTGRGGRGGNPPCKKKKIGRRKGKKKLKNSGDGGSGETPNVKKSVPRATRPRWGPVQQPMNA